MAKTIHNKKERVTALHHIVESASGVKSSFELSDVKRDETVFVRFRSVDDCPAVTIACRVAKSLMTSGHEFTQIDDNKLRIKLP